MLDFVWRSPAPFSLSMQGGLLAMLGNVAQGSKYDLNRIGMITSFSRGAIMVLLNCLFVLVDSCCGRGFEELCTSHESEVK